MILRLIRWSYWLLILSLPFVRPSVLSYPGVDILLTDLLFLVVLALVLIGLLTRELPFKYDTAYPYLFAYAVALTMATLYSNDRHLLKLSGEYYLIGLCVITILVCPRVVSIRSFVNVWLAATLIVSLLALIGACLFYLGDTTPNNNYFMSRAGSLPTAALPRIQSLFANPNMFCSYLNIGVMLALGGYGSKWINKRTLGVLTLILGAATALTLSPGIGGVILSVGLWLFFDTSISSRLRRTGLVIGVAGAVTIFVATVVSPDTTNTDQDLRIPYTSIVIEPSIRVLVWEDAVHRIEEQPLIGRGVGANAASVRYVTILGDQQLLTDAHDVWLNITAQAGLLGLAAMVCLALHLWVRCRFWTPDADSGPMLRALSCAFVGAFLYQGLAGSFEDARHLWIGFGLLVASSSTGGSGIKAVSE